MNGRLGDPDAEHRGPCRAAPSAAAGCAPRRVFAALGDPTRLRLSSHGGRAAVDRPALRGRRRHAPGRDQAPARAGGRGLGAQTSACGRESLFALDPRPIGSGRNISTKFAAMGPRPGAAEGACRGDLERTLRKDWRKEK